MSLPLCDRRTLRPKLSHRDEMGALWNAKIANGAKF
jgi:hypothetical protein